MKSLTLILTLSLATVSLFAAEKKPAPKMAPPAKAKVVLQPNPKKLGPPPGIVVPATVKAELSAGAAALGREIANLETALKSRPELLALLPDVQIFQNAVAYAVTDDIFYSEKQFDTARALLKLGHERVAQLKAGQTPWTTATGPVVRGYVSKLDGSVQPYGLIVPASFKPGNKPMRLDFWLHGRSDTLSELAFLEGRLKGSSEFLPADTFVLHPYGRFMNAFKFAGEVDVFEGLEHVAKHYPIDRNRLAMRGFSMGGAGTWHLGAHHADRWAAVNPGAGFVDVKNYQKLGDKLDTIPWWEQKLWNLYDPLACPINLVSTTLVAYSGEDDGQKAAADLMEAALAKEGVKMTHIIGPKTGHKYEPEAKKVVGGLVDAAAAKGVSHQPKKVTLVTHSLKFNKAHWVTINAMEKHWEPARVEAEMVTPGKYSIKTTNVSELTIHNKTEKLIFRIDIDGQGIGIRVSAGDDKGDYKYGDLTLSKQNGKWNLAKVRPEDLAKRHNLQGPIDDAFMDSFLFVKPTGQPMNPQVGKWVDTELKEAAFHWHRFFRGNAPTKDDSAVSDDDLKNNNLVLWGDPSSNQQLAKIADKLPIKWTAKGIEVGGKTYDAAKHVPVLIYPNPLNPSRYVVINSGFTFPQFAASSNSLQTPKLPDWAVLDLGVPLLERVNGRGVVAANFFSEKWELLEK